MHEPNPNLEFKLRRAFREMCVVAMPGAMLLLATNYLFGKPDGILWPGCPFICVVLFLAVPPCLGAVWMLTRGSAQEEQFLAWFVPLVIMLTVISFTELMVAGLVFSAVSTVVKSLRGIRG